MGICTGTSRRMEMRWYWRIVRDRMRNHPCWLRLLARSRTPGSRCCVLISRFDKRVRMGLHFPQRQRKTGKELAERRSFCDGLYGGEFFLAATLTAADRQRCSPQRSRSSRRD
jgi:hypothetical protein